MGSVKKMAAASQYVVLVLVGRVEIRGSDYDISANGLVSFAKPVASGLPYKVTVLTQPTGQLCLINSGAGTVGAAKITVPVSCAALPDAWNWIGGSSTVGAFGAYGTLGLAEAGNVPGARYGAISWVDSAGNVWLFGGEGYDSSGTVGALNDLWEYSAGLWKWVSGANTVNATGTYGTLGHFAAANMLASNLPTKEIWPMGLSHSSEEN